MTIAGEQAVQASQSWEIKGAGGAPLLGLHIISILLISRAMDRRLPKALKATQREWSQLHLNIIPPSAANEGGGINKALSLLSYTDKSMGAIFPI